jgi:hypothetical protein
MRTHGVSMLSPGDNARMAIRERLAAQRMVTQRMDDCVDRIIAEVTRTIPTYRTLGDSQRQETLAIAHWATRRLLELWVSDGGYDEHDRRRFQGIGATRATDGRPLLSVLRAYRVASVVLIDTIMELAGPVLDKDDLVALNRVTLTTGNDLSEAVFDGYADATARLRSGPDEVVSQLADDLLTGRQTSPAALADRARQLNLTLPDTFTLFVLPADDLAMTVHSGQTSLRARRDGLTALIADRLDPFPDALTSEARERGWRACRVDDVRAAELPAQFRLASTAVRFGPADAFQATPVLGPADAGLIGLLRGLPTVEPAAVARQALGPLVEARRAHLLQGLRGYLRYGSSTEAAAALGLHPQTMRHRLRRVTSLTGRDVRRSWDRLLLDVACTTHAMGSEASLS